MKVFFGLLIVFVMCTMVASQECPKNLNATLCNAATGFVVEGEINFNEPRFVFYLDAKDQFYLQVRELREMKVEEEEAPQVFKKVGDTEIEFDKDETSVDFVNVPVMEDLGDRRRMIYVASVNLTGTDNLNNLTSIRINATLPKDLNNGDTEETELDGVLCHLTIELFDYFFKDDGDDVRLLFELEMSNEDGDDELNRNSDNTYISASFDARFQGWNGYFLPADGGAQESLETATFLTVDTSKIMNLVDRYSEEAPPGTFVFEARFGFGAASSLHASFMLASLLLVLFFFIM